MSRDIAEWQRRFYDQPRVWVVVDRDGCIEGVYATKAAAQVTIDGFRKSGESMRSYDAPICSVELAAERWEDA